MSPLGNTLLDLVLGLAAIVFPFWLGRLTAAPRCDCASYRAQADRARRSGEAFARARAAAAGHPAGENRASEVERRLSAMVFGEHGQHGQVLNMDRYARGGVRPMNPKVWE